MYMKQIIMKRRLLCKFPALLIFCILFAGMTVTANATETNLVEDLSDSYFQIEDSILVKYTGAEKDVVIPEGVTVIGAQAFQDNQDVESVTIPVSVTSIGKAAFLKCRNLEVLKIEGCEEGTSCLETIGHLAFSGTAIKDITLPASLTTIGNAVFANVDDDFDASTRNTVPMVEWVVNEPIGVIENVTIIDTEENPSHLTSLGTEVFNSCHYLKSINLPQSLTTLGRADFRGCKSLTEIIIPDQITELPRLFFVLCESLKSVKLPNKLEKIGDWAFERCSSLTNLIIPENVTELYYALFFLSSTNVFFKNDVPPTIINGSSHTLFLYFQGKAYVPTQELKDYFVENGGISASKVFVLDEDMPILSEPELPTDLMILSGTYSARTDASGEIVNGKIGNLSAMVGFCAQEELPDIIRNNAALKEHAEELNSALYNQNFEVKDTIALSLYVMDSAGIITKVNDAKLSAPITVTVDYEYAIMGEHYQLYPWNGIAFDNPITVLCTEDGSLDITTDVFCPFVMVGTADTGLVIEGNTLVAYTGFRKNVVIPDGVTAIAAQAFQDNQNIKNVTIPASVTSIGKAAFLRCRNLEVLKIEGCEDGTSCLKTVGHLAFSGTAIKNITLPASLITIGNAVFANVDDDFDVATHNAVVMLDGLIGEPVSALERVVIIDTNENPSHLTSIGSLVFNNCQYLQSMNLPQSLTALGFAVFRGCKSLTEITIPDQVTEIQRHMFVKCESLQIVNLPSTLTKIGNWAFAHCYALTDIVIPKSVVELGYAFVSGNSANVIFTNDALPLIQNGASYNLFSLFKGKVYVPTEELKDYFVINCDIEESKVFVIEEETPATSISVLSVD